MIAGWSKPSTSRPASSFIVKSIGPTRRCLPLARTQSSAAFISAAATSASSSNSMKPNIPSLPPWYSSQRGSTMGA